MYQPTHEQSSSGLTGMPPHYLSQAHFSEPQYIPQPAQEPAPEKVVTPPARKGRKRKFAETGAERPQQSLRTGTVPKDNQRIVESCVTLIDDPQVPNQTVSRNRFVAAIEHAVSLSGDAFTEAKNNFMELPVSSAECVKQYMLGCKILAQYAKAKLSATEQSCCVIFWSGLGKMYLASVTARNDSDEKLVRDVCSSIKLCAFDGDTPRKIILRSGQAMEIDFKGRKEKSPEKSVATAIRMLGLKGPLKDAPKAKGFGTRQDPCWDVLLEKLKASASQQSASATAAPGAQVREPALPPPPAKLVYRVGQYEVEGNSSEGEIIGKLLRKTLNSEEASSYLDRRNASPEEVAIYAHILVLLMQYFEATQSGSDFDGSEVFWRGMHTMSNDLLRAKQKNNDPPKWLKAIDFELTGANLPAEFSDIVAACINSNRRLTNAAYLKFGLKPIVEKASVLGSGAGRLTYKQMLDRCVVPSDAPVPVFTTTTTVTTSARTSATTEVVQVGTGQNRDEDCWPEFPPETPYFGKADWEAEPFDLEDLNEPESLPDESR